MKLLITALFAAVLLPRALPAEAGPECIARGEHQAVTYLLIDRSEPIAAREAFTQTLAAAAGMIRPGERLIVGLSHDRASETHVVMDLVKPAESVWTSILKTRKEQKVFQSCFDRVRDDLLVKEERAKHTPLLETLYFVGKVLSGEAAAERRLIVYSDMIQNSPAVSFYGGENLDVPAALKKVELEDLIADLKSVKVLAAGAGGAVSDHKARQLEKFWKVYFERCGGKLEFYGPVLLPG